MRQFQGLLFIKHGRVGSRSEGPDYYIQTSQRDLLLRYSDRHPWKPDFHLEFCNRQMVKVTGKIDEEGVIDVETIETICERLIPQYTTYQMRIFNDSRSEIVDFHLSMVGVPESVSIPKLSSGTKTGYYEFRLKNLREDELAPVSYGDYSGGYTQFEKIVLIFVPTPPSIATIKIGDKGYSIEGEWPVQPPEPELVAEVTRVELLVSEEDSRQLEITAIGNAPTAGWTDIHLRPHLYDCIPPDGIYDYDFLATPPDGPAPTVITPVKATLTLSAIPEGLKGVRIYARRNKQVALVKEASAYFEFSDNKDDKFVIKLVEKGKIRHARAILNGADVASRHIAGTVVKERAPYNPRWSYHLAPSSISFFDAAIDTCDSTIRCVQEHLEEVGGSFLPDCHWCPWSSELTKELRYIDEM